MWSTPSHPSTNRLPGSLVQTFKKAMKAGEKDGLPLTTRLSQFLMCYRLTPHTTTKISPSELFLKHAICIWFDLLKPDLQRIVNNIQSSQKKNHNQHTKLPQFATGQFIMAREFNSSNKWTSGEIIKQSGPLSYVVKISDGRVVCRHVDHVCVCSMKPPNDEETCPDFELFPDQSSTTTSSTTNEPPPKPEPEPYSR